ncbi:MAG TPA: sodium:solute symporter [Bacteroidales bacterium]|nr:sodium:solute symporter [Bacteroidales bacterium]
MSPVLILVIIFLYFSFLLFIGWITGRRADSESFFIGNRKSPWLIVAIGMIGASLSGVTFISVPGWVIDSQFSYMQMVLGYLVGYAVIAEVLLPLYYRLKLTSIYTYLENRFGHSSYKTGASFFLLSRTIGAAFRLFLVAIVLQFTVFDAWNVPFVVTVAITLLLIWLYTFRGGIKTIIWTDAMQTVFMLTAVILTVLYISKSMDMNFASLIDAVRENKSSRIFFFDDFNDQRHFVKQFLGGMFITIVMTGLDQDMMQKNLSISRLRDAKKNVYTYGIAFVPVNLIFMTLGVLLLIYASFKGMALPDHADNLFPMIATQGGLGAAVSIFFILGLIAAAYSSADSALTALTTSFTVDILGRGGEKESVLRKVRFRVHIMFSFILMVVILVFRLINDQSVISALFTVAGYTYGPLLGMYSFGLFTRWKVKDRFVPAVAVISPLLCVLLNIFSEELFRGYKFGFELLLVNGIITFLGMMLIRQREPREESDK